MISQNAAPPLAPNPQASKRKFPIDSDNLARKKRRAAGPRIAPSDSRAENSAPSNSSYSQVSDPLLRRLSQKYEVKAMSVMPSTSISNHVDRALEHLGRFSAWDASVLPGVVLLCAKSTASSKLVTISELIRRRISESDQKWFQYNLLSETMTEEEAPSVKDTSVVEDTFLDVGSGSEDKADDEYFETRQPTIHERAVQPPKIKYKAHMTVLLSRVPLGELKAERNVALQTNEQHIEYSRKKKLGLVG